MAAAERVKTEAGQKGKREESIHKGHRERLKKLFLTSRLAGMSDYQVLELLLTFGIPNGDVNPLSHRLIDTFGSISGVLTADYEALLQVDGVGPHTATLLCLIPALASRYQVDRSCLGGQLTCTEHFWRELAPYFVGARVEECYMLCMDGMGKLITCCKLGEGVVNKINIPQRRVMEAALRHNAAVVVLAHNHVSGFAQPSTADIAYTQALSKLLESVEVKLMDHLVLSDDDWVSMAESGYL